MIKQTVKAGGLLLWLGSHAHATSCIGDTFKSLANAKCKVSSSSHAATVLTKCITDALAETAEDVHSSEIYARTRIQTRFATLCEGAYLQHSLEQIRKDVQVIQELGDVPKQFQELGKEETEAIEEMIKAAHEGGSAMSGVESVSEGAFRVQVRLEKILERAVRAVELVQERKEESAILIEDDEEVDNKGGKTAATIGCLLAMVVAVGGSRGGLLGVLVVVGEGVDVFRRMCGVEATVLRLLVWAGRSVALLLSCAALMRMKERGEEGVSEMSGERSWQGTEDGPVWSD